jgi:hypothetical protein
MRRRPLVALCNRRGISRNILCRLLMSTRKGAEALLDG